MAEITTKTAHEIWLTAEKIKRVADKLVGIGPIGIGIEGFLAPVPLAADSNRFEYRCRRAFPYHLLRILFRNGLSSEIKSVSRSPSFGFSCLDLVIYTG